MKRLPTIIKDIKFARQIHLEWGKRQKKNEIKYVRNAAWHRKWVKIYDDTLYYLEKLN